MTRFLVTLMIILAGGMLYNPASWAKDKPSSPIPIDYDARLFPVLGSQGMVAAQDSIAAQVGSDILKRGGNAVDAAVATGFALAVTHPQAGNIGGGGFMLIALEGHSDVVALDFREVAPASSHRDMYLNSLGEVDGQLVAYSHLSAGVPGTVMGLLEALDKYGTMSRRQVLGPAIRLASHGFVVSPSLSASLLEHKDRLSVDESSLKYFYGPDHLAPQPGERLYQSDLANSLRRILKDGSDGFYKGKTAKLLIKEIQKGGGIITQTDLDNYKVVTRKALKGRYKGYDVYSMPPPSSGGVHLIQMLNILSAYDLSADGHNSADYMHKLIEVMRRAYADRSQHLGDPDFYPVPVAGLTDPAYANHLRETIDLETASLSSDIAPATSLPFESPQTTHYSTMDKWGNAVSVTYTLNYSYGSGHSVDGAGFLLNNEMDDFSAKPGVPNGYGLIGGEANKIEPSKRPLSSMTPTIVKKDGDVVLVTGSIGGSRIITATLQVVLNVVEFGMNVAEAVNAPRLHHQWLPDIVIVEPGISEDSLDILSGRGFIFETHNDGAYKRSVFGRANSVAFEEEYFQGAADKRDPKSGAFGP